MTHTDTLNTAISAVRNNIQAGTLPSGRRIQVHAAYCYLVIEHHCAITHLIEHKMPCAAFALARPTYEALVKGLWLYHCATDDVLERHVQGTELKQISTLTKELLETDLPRILTRSLANVKSKYWQVLSSLTHVGHTQIKHFLSTSSTEAHYSDAEINEMANFVAFMCIAAGRELTLLANNHDGAKLLLAMLPSATEP